MEYINKDTILEEIENLIDKGGKYWDEYDSAYRDGNNGALYSLKEKINSLEVKNVDFETAFAASVDHFDEKNNYGQWPESDLKEFAKHFLELGINMKNYNNKCEDLRADGICNFALTKLDKTWHCENISCTRKI